ncbi:hypothetical protein [Paenibacillus sacheonensis]|uniref:Uncharacterized protein n=1 Tax=Paenibacillus sacheonensis TaxID=742054 RepID=A0A7X5BWP6_9BACL|nr:hypothetical protein [Paenibacillus sacheonensis]MBM7564170.1 hypothetical protein [Paenibacillus sacheonensis]NBC67501.1 hypothetical protein [Paenibacillus sacheonensis]
MKRRSWGVTYTALLCRLILDENKWESQERYANHDPMEDRLGRTASRTGSSRKAGAR